jgi:hypothetical protein
MQHSKQESLFNSPALKERLFKMIDDAKSYHQAISTLKLTTYQGTHKGFAWVSDNELEKNNLCWEEGRLKEILEQLPCGCCARRIEYLLKADPAVSGLSTLTLQNTSTTIVDSK